MKKLVVVAAKALLCDEMKQTYFELFGLNETYAVNTSFLEEKRQQLLQQFHPDRFVNATPHEKRLAVQYSALINDAYNTLLDPVKRAAYLLKLHHIDVDFENNTNMPAEFLVEQMEWHEKLADTSDEVERQQVLIELENKFKQLIAEIEQIFAKQDFGKARELARQLKFYQKLCER